MAKVRDYSKEYKDYHGKPEQVARRSARNKSVRELNREGKGSSDGKDVHHVDNNPMNRSKGNMKVISKAKNRSMK
jgi:hypothetical protein